MWCLRHVVDFFFKSSFVTSWTGLLYFFFCIRHGTVWPGRSRSRRQISASINLVPEKAIILSIKLSFFQSGGARHLEEETYWFIVFFSPMAQEWVKLIAWLLRRLDWLLTGSETLTTMSTTMLFMARGRLDSVLQVQSSISLSRLAFTTPITNLCWVTVMSCRFSRLRVREKKAREEKKRDCL